MNAAPPISLVSAADRQALAPCFAPAQVGALKMLRLAAHLAKAAADAGERSDDWRTLWPLFSATFAPLAAIAQRVVDGETPPLDAVREIEALGDLSVALKNWSPPA